MLCNIQNVQSFVYLKAVNVYKLATFIISKNLHIKLPVSTHAKLTYFSTFA